MSNHVDGKVIIITGAAGGFGRLVAEKTAALGARVVAADIDEVALESVTDGIATSGGRALAVRADVTQRSDMHALLVEAFGEAGAVSHPVETRTQIVRALANLREPQAAPLFAAHIADPTPAIRLEAIRGLDRLGSRAETHVPSLVDQFAVSDDMTKVRIAHALGSIGGETARKAVEQMMTAEGNSAALQRTLRAALNDLQKGEAASGPTSERPGLGAGG